MLTQRQLCHRAGLPEYSSFATSEARLEGYIEGMEDRTKKKAFQRRDGTGHLNPRYAAGLRELGQETAAPVDDDRAFVSTHTTDGLAEQLGESFVQSATSGESCAEDMADVIVTEETGGPFVDSNQEFAYDTDESNPPEAGREPFPKS